MSGIKYLLDTNFILGLLKATPEVAALVAGRTILAAECGYSAITRMELLGFAGLTESEDVLIRQRLSQLTYCPVVSGIEDFAIALRRARQIKLPDAIIAATANYHSAELLTLDMRLDAVMRAK